MAPNQFGSNLETGQLADNGVPQLNMAAHGEPLLGGQGVSLQKNVLRNADFSDVVKQGPPVNLAELFSIGNDSAGQYQRVAGASPRVQSCFQFSQVQCSN
jgi:hypothetical protein